MLGTSPTLAFETKSNDKLSTEPMHEDNEGSDLSQNPPSFSTHNYLYLSCAPNLCSSEL